MSMLENPQNPQDNIIRFRASSPLLAQLEKRVDAFAPSVHLVAQKELDWLHTFLPTVLPTFTHREAMLMIDAMNGVILDRSSLRLFTANIIDAIEVDGLDKKWGVSKSILIAQLRSYNIFEIWAIYDAIQQAWGNEYHTENMQERLIQVGLVEKDQEDKDA